MQTQAPKLSLKKPTLDEFINNCKQMYEAYPSIFGAEYSLEKYLEVQRAFYRQTLADLSQEDYEKFVEESKKAVINRFKKIIDMGGK